MNQEMQRAMSSEVEGIIIELLQLLVQLNDEMKFDFKTHDDDDDDENSKNNVVDN